MVAADTGITEYNLIKVIMEGVKPFKCMGIKITDTMETDQEYHGASNEAFQTTMKKRKVEFEILEPRDHADLQNVAMRCRQGESFTIVAMGQDRNKNWKAMETLIGCVIPNRERTLGNLESPKLSIKGTAQDSIPRTTQFE